MTVRAVLVLEQASEEIAKLPASEQNAVAHALDKLEAVGDRLGYPHTSAVLGTADDLRELRPRAGRSPWRVLYRRVGEALVLAAVAPEAQRDSRGFARGMRRAADRLAELEGE
jgi:hypothetical protein